MSLPKINTGAVPARTSLPLTVPKQPSHIAATLGTLADTALYSYQIIDVPNQPLTFVVKQGSEVSDQALQGLMAKTDQVSRQATLVDVNAPDSGSPPVNTSLDTVFQQATEGMRVGDNGHLIASYSHAGKTTEYDTGMTPGGFKAMLAAGLRTNSVAQRTIRVIEGKGQQEVYAARDSSTEALSLVHKGSFIAKGGAGSVHVALDVLKHEVVALKTATQLPETGRSATDRENAVLLDLTGGQRRIGVQEAPRQLIQIGGSEPQSGFSTALYDMDMSAALAQGSETRLNLSTDAMIDGFSQLAQGARYVASQGYKNSDVKAANVFVKRSGDQWQWDLADWDAASKMDAAFFASEAFKENPAGESSSDASTPSEYKWLRKLGEAIVAKAEQVEEVASWISDAAQKRAGLEAEDINPSIGKRLANFLGRGSKKEVEQIKEDLVAMKAEADELYAELEQLTSQYKDLVNGMQSWALAALGFQLLKGDVVRWSHDINPDSINQLQIEISEADIPEKEKQARLELLDLITPSLAAVLPPDRGMVIDAKTRVPVREGVEHLATGVQEILERLHT